MSDCSEEAEILKKNGVNIIIALGHSGYNVDQEIARKCPLVDAVIGGHTNTFLYNGEQPNVEKPEGPYPTVIKQASGKEVPVVQAYAYTKYLGELKLSVSELRNFPCRFNARCKHIELQIWREIKKSQFIFVFSSMLTVICYRGRDNQLL